MSFPLRGVGLRFPAQRTPLTYRYQQILHRNLVYLATIADSNQNMQSLLPAVSARGGQGAASGQGLTWSSQGDRLT